MVVGTTRKTAAIARSSPHQCCRPASRKKGRPVGDRVSPEAIRGLRSFAGTRDAGSCPFAANGKDLVGHDV